ncbi:cytoplasmic protein, partial [Escherichia coli]
SFHLSGRDSSRTSGFYIYYTSKS